MQKSGERSTESVTTESVTTERLAVGQALRRLPGDSAWGRDWLVLGTGGQGGGYFGELLAESRCGLGKDIFDQRLKQRWACGFFGHDCGLDLGLDGFM